MNRVFVLAALCLFSLSIGCGGSAETKVLDTSNIQPADVNAYSGSEEAGPAEVQSGGGPPAP